MIERAYNPWRMNGLDQIDWRLVAFSAVWLTGLAVVLATFSFADYLAAQRQVRTRVVLGWPGSLAAIYAGFLLFCVGLFGTAPAWWQQALWALLAVAFGCLAWAAWRRRTPL